MPPVVNSAPASTCPSPNQDGDALAGADRPRQMLVGPYMRAGPDDRLVDSAFDDGARADDRRAARPLQVGGQVLRRRAAVDAHRVDRKRHRLQPTFLGGATPRPFVEARRLGS